MRGYPSDLACFVQLTTSMRDWPVFFATTLSAVSLFGTPRRPFSWFRFGGEAGLYLLRKQYSSYASARASSGSKGTPGYMNHCGIRNRQNGGLVSFYRPDKAF